MAVTAETLLVRMEATQAKFDKQLKKAEMQANRSSRRIERRFTRMNKNLSRQFRGVTASFSKGFIGGLASVATVAGIKRLNSAVQETVSEFSNIAKVADKVGVTTEQLQLLRKAAELTGNTAKGLDDGLQRFSRRVGEAANGTGVLKDILMDNNIAIREQNGAIRPVIEIFKDYADLVDRTRSSQEKLRLTFKAFDKEGAGLVNLFKGGSRGIDQTLDRLRELGLAIDENLLRRAEKLEDEFDLATEALSLRFKEVLIEIAPFLTEAAKALASLVRSMRQLRGGDADAAAIQFQKTTDRVRELNEQLFKVRENIKVLEDQGTLRSPGLEAGRQQVIQFNKAREQEIVAELSELEGVAEMDKRAAEVSVRLEEMKRVLGALNQKIMEEREAVGTAAGVRGGRLQPLTGENVERAARKGLLELIKLAEGTVGTSRSRGFDTTLGFGQFTGGPITLVNKTLREILAIQTKMLRAPGNNFTDASGAKGSSALGAFQITKRTLKSLIDQLGLSLDEVFTPELQQRLALTLIERRGRNVKQLRNEWEGLRRVEEGAILRAFDNTKQIGQERARQVSAQRQILEGQRQSNAELELENSLIGASTFEREKVLTQQRLLNELKRAGIPITSELKAAVSELANSHAMLASAAETSADSLEDQAAALEDTKALFKDVLSGFLDDLRNGEKLSDALWNALRKIEDKLIDIALTGLLDAIFGGGASGGGATGLGGILSSIFGFKKGGLVEAKRDGGMISGPGTGRSDSIMAVGPDGRPLRLSDGEFVVNAKATRENLPLLESLNSGMMPRFRDGTSMQQGPMPAPVVNLRSVNAIDSPSFLSEALATKAGEDVLVNHISARPARFRAALGV